MMRTTAARKARHQRACRDDDVLRGLRASLTLRGRMPTMKELCADIAITRGCVTRVIPRLIENGRLKAYPRGTLLLRIVENQDGAA